MVVVLLVVIFLLTVSVFIISSYSKSLKVKLIAVEEKNKKINSQKKASEVRLGLIAEQLAPFLDDFPADPSTVVFLGKPIDYISFSEEGVKFIEVKSGNAKLSSPQRTIRDQIKEGKVSFELFKIKGK